MKQINLVAIFQCCMYLAEFEAGARSSAVTYCQCFGHFSSSIQVLALKAKETKW